MKNKTNYNTTKNFKVFRSSSSVKFLLHKKRQKNIGPDSKWKEWKDIVFWTEKCVENEKENNASEYSNVGVWRGTACLSLSSPLLNDFLKNSVPVRVIDWEFCGRSEAGSAGKIWTWMPEFVHFLSTSRTFRYIMIPEKNRFLLINSTSINLMIESLIEVKPTVVESDEFDNWDLSKLKAFFENFALSRFQW